MRSRKAPRKLWSDGHGHQEKQPGTSPPRRTSSPALRKRRQTPLQPIKVRSRNSCRCFAIERPSSMPAQLEHPGQEVTCLQPPITHVEGISALRSDGDSPQIVRTLVLVDLLRLGSVHVRLKERGDAASGEMAQVALSEVSNRQKAVLPEISRLVGNARNLQMKRCAMRCWNRARRNAFPSPAAPRRCVRRAMPQLV
jgi:hypothetical protein